MKKVQSNLLFRVFMLIGIATSSLQGMNNPGGSSLQQYGHPAGAALAFLGGAYAIKWGYKKIQEGCEYYEHLNKIDQWERPNISLWAIVTRSRRRVVREAKAAEEALQKALNKTKGRSRTYQERDTEKRLSRENLATNAIFNIHKEGAFPYSTLSIMLGSASIVCSLYSMYLFLSSKR